MQTTIATQIWEQDPEKPAGYQRLARTKTIGEVYQEIRDVVGEFPEGCNEYFSVSPMLPADTLWPEGRITVYPVTGDSEGHYIHVDVNGSRGEHQMIFLGKTFDGWDAAWSFAKKLAELLDV